MDWDVAISIWKRLKTKKPGVAKGETGRLAGWRL
jgi:hypothetical protein